MNIKVGGTLSVTAQTSKMQRLQATEYGSGFTKYMSVNNEESKVCGMVLPHL